MKARILFLFVLLTATQVSFSAPGNDDYASPTSINPGDTIFGDTTSATFDDVGFCGTSNTAPGVWYEVTGTGNGMIASTCDQADYDTKISVFDGSGVNPVCIGGNDDAAGCSGFTTEFTWPTTPGVPYKILVHGFASATGSFDLTLTEVISSGNDSYESPTPINIGETVSGSTTAATLDGVAFCGTSNTAPGVWYTVTGNGDTLTASTCNQANYDTKISIFDATGGGQVCVDGQDDAAGCAGFTTELSWPSVAGVPYNILVHGFGTATGDFDLTISGPDNEAPVAIAGVDQSIRAGDTVNLDGSGSFDDNTASVDLMYSWSFFFLSEGLSTPILSGANTATPSFVAGEEGSYVLQLIVTDEHAVASLPDYVTVSSDNQAPTAAAGDDQLVITGTVVVLDGTGSIDPETDPLSFDWVITNTPSFSTATLTGATTAAPTFIPDLDGVYEITLTVSDFIGPGTPDSVEVTSTTAEGFAEIQIVSANDIIKALSNQQVTTKGNQNALQNFLRQAIAALQEGDLARAIDKLEKAIARTDGCALRGAPDGNGGGRDWITECASQADVYTMLNDALDALLAL